MKLTPCEKCGCTGIHACVGVKYVTTEEDKKRQEKQLSELGDKLWKLDNTVEKS